MPYVEVNQLIAALDGAHGGLPDASGAYSIQIDWRTDLRQLWLQLDTLHRIS